MNRPSLPRDLRGRAAIRRPAHRAGRRRAGEDAGRRRLRLAGGAGRRRRSRTSISDAPGRSSVLPPAATEVEVIDELRALAAKNTVAKPMIGLGYYGTRTPAVIRRNVLENPAWYTAYTPYQPEISQGRLEALLNFQTVIADLTGLPVAGASLLDEPTAAAEAMSLCRRISTSKSHRFYVDADVLPQTQAVVRTRALPMGFEVVVADLTNGLPDADCFGVLVQDPAPADGCATTPRWPSRRTQPARLSSPRRTCWR